MLKSLIKECLVEILVEGISESNLVSSLNEAKNNAKTNAKKIYDDAKNKENPNSSLVENKNFDRKVKNTVSAMSKDPVMQWILSDTAQTTLQEQRSPESNRAIPPKTNVPVDVFGEASKNWSALAFSEKQNSN